MNKKGLEMPKKKEQLRPLDEVSGFPVRPGLYGIHGASQLENAVNFTIHSHHAFRAELLLYERGAKEPYARLPFPDKYRIGKVFSMIVFGLDIEQFEYAYCLDGPYQPERGLLFDKNRPLLDPYAKAVTGQSQWGKRRSSKDHYRARVVKNNFDWGNDHRQLAPMSDLIIYELHVRGFTMDASSKVKHPGTFAGILEKIPYLKELGITAVELMPIFEFDELMGEREIAGKRLPDYWGYNTVSFFAPNTSYASGIEYNREGLELKLLIKALHDAGLEVILDVVFNHTAEGNEKGPVISFKGFDNNIYYMLTPQGEYYNFSGCGNTLNCNHPIVQEMIVECLRYWTTEYRVDGFRFDLASILGRDEDGMPMNNPPLLKRLAFDPLLGNVKLIAEAWDAGGLYQVGDFPAWNRWAEWNGKYRDSMREYLKGNYGISQEAAARITGSLDLYDGVYCGYNSSVNFLNCHDGFTLYDMYAYNYKHNEANGWDNTDGTNDNRSWNCGFEGVTNDAAVNQLRLRMMKNACIVLMCSRGTPMFLAGDEFGNTSFGNNNPYCQDNEISWLNWDDLLKNSELLKFFKKAIAFRKNHPAIRRDLAKSRQGFPSVSTYTAEQGTLGVWEHTKVLGVLYAGWDEEEEQEDLVFLAVNVFWEAMEIKLPELSEGYCWKVAIDTMVLDGSAEEKTASPLVQYLLSPRTTAVFTGQKCHRFD